MTGWGAVTCNAGESCEFAIGTLRISLERHDRGWRVATPGERSPDIAGPLDGDVRHLRAAAVPTLYVAPTLPDLPLLVKPDEPIHIVPGGRVMTPLACPVFVRVSHRPVQRGRPLPSAVVDLPSQPLKRTWFGTGVSGESAYEHELHAEGGETPGEGFVTIPLSIHNASNDILLFERLLARVIHLNVFMLDGALHANAIRVRFRGTEQISQITIAPDDDLLSKNAVFLGGRREPFSTDILRRSFLLLKDLTA